MAYGSDRVPTRRVLAAGLVGTAAASWVFHSYLWSSFMKSHPRKAQPETGFTYVMNNHGLYYYLTAIESTQLGLMSYLAIGAFLMAIVANGKVPEKRAWEVYAKQARFPIAPVVMFFLIWLVVLSVWSRAWAACLVQFHIVIPL